MFPFNLSSSSKDDTLFSNAFISNKNEPWDPFSYDELDNTNSRVNNNNIRESNISNQDGKDATNPPSVVTDTNQDGNNDFGATHMGQVVIRWCGTDHVT